jgi:hypothetical protein
VVAGGPLPDAVVLEIGPSVSDRGDNADLGVAGITFEVREWFAEGDADTVTVDPRPSAKGLRKRVRPSRSAPASS